MKKGIYSLHALKKALDAANRRYLEFISSIDDPTTGMKKLDKISKPISQKGRTYKGFNFFAASDQHLFEILVRGEHNLSGMRNKDIRKHMPESSPARVSRIIKRLRTHGIPFPAFCSRVQVYSSVLDVPINITLQNWGDRSQLRG
jgi:hypothetical protein